MSKSTEVTVSESSRLFLAQALGVLVKYGVSRLEAKVTLSKILLLQQEHIKRIEKEKLKS